MARTSNPAPHCPLYDSLAADKRSHFATSLPIFSDHRVSNLFTAHSENHLTESRSCAKSHRVSNHLTPDPRSHHPETLPHKKNHHYISAFPRNSNSTSRDPSNRPSHETHLFAGDAMHETHHGPVFLLDSQSRKNE